MFAVSNFIVFFAVEQTDEYFAFVLYLNRNELQSLLLIEWMLWNDPCRFFSKHNSACAQLRGAANKNIRVSKQVCLFELFGCYCPRVLGSKRKLGLKMNELDCRKAWAYLLFSLLMNYGFRNTRCCVSCDILHAFYYMLHLISDELDVRYFLFISRCVHIGSTCNIFETRRWLLN